jgi:hypothetical protein
LRGQHFFIPLPSAHPPFALNRSIEPNHNHTKFLSIAIERSERMQQRPSSPRGGRAVLRANNGLLVAAAALLLLTLAPPFVAATVFTVTSTAGALLI